MDCRRSRRSIQWFRKIAKTPYKGNEDSKKRGRQALLDASHETKQPSSEQRSSSIPMHFSSVGGLEIGVGCWALGCLLWWYGKFKVLRLNSAP